MYPTEFSRSCWRVCNIPGSSMLNFRQKVWYLSLLHYYVEWSIFSTIMPCMLQDVVELTSLILYRRSSLTYSPSHNSLILRKTRHRKNAEKGADQMNLEIDWLCDKNL